MHKVLRALFRDQWPKLTDDDLDRASGQVGRLTALLGEKYGYPPRRAERELIHFLDDSMRRIDQGAIGATRRARSAQEVVRVGRVGDKGGEATGRAGEREGHPRRALVDVADLR